MTKKKKVFISYSSADGEFFERLVHALSLENNTLEVVIDKEFIEVGDTIDLDGIKERIRKSDIFLLVLSNNSLQSGWVIEEYNCALKLREGNKEFLFIPLLIEDIDKTIKLPFSLKSIKYVDFRNPFYFLRDLNKLFIKIFDKSESKREIIKELIYQLSIDPSIEVIRLQRILEDSIEKKFEHYLRPMNKSLEMLTKLNQASERILTLEAIAEKEKSASDSIWVISTHLNNDVHDEEIKKSVKENQGNGIKYIYFVPDTPQIEKRKLEYEKEYKDVVKEDEKNHRFIEMDVKEIVMPFAEVVLYDPEDHMSIWGYVQLNYDDRTTDKNSVFLRIPYRNLFPLADSLRARKKLDDKNKEEGAKNE